LTRISLNLKEIRSRGTYGIFEEPVWEDRAKWDESWRFDLRRVELIHTSKSGHGRMDSISNEWKSMGKASVVGWISVESFVARDWD